MPQPKSNESSNADVDTAINNVSTKQGKNFGTFLTLCIHEEGLKVCSLNKNRLDMDLLLSPHIEQGTQKAYCKHPIDSEDPILVCPV